jgi:hypothetical protein
MMENKHRNNLVYLVRGVVRLRYGRTSRIKFDSSLDRIYEFDFRKVLSLV